MALGREHSPEGEGSLYGWSAVTLGWIQYFQYIQITTNFNSMVLGREHSP